MRFAARQWYRSRGPPQRGNAIFSGHPPPARHSALPTTPFPLRFPLYSFKNALPRRLTSYSATAEPADAFTDHVAELLRFSRGVGRGKRGVNDEWVGCEGAIRSVRARCTAAPALPRWPSHPPAAEGVRLAEAPGRCRAARRYEIRATPAAMAERRCIGLDARLPRQGSSACPWQSRP